MVFVSFGVKVVKNGIRIRIVQKGRMESVDSNRRIARFYSKPKFAI